MTIKPPLRPTTISIPLQRADIVEACPEVRRCHLEVIAAEHGEVLSVDDGSIARTKVVRVGIFQEDKGCDYKIRVGLVADGGVVAVGDTALPSGHREVWEWLLPGCADNQAPLFTHRPYRLSQVRYLYNGEMISLFHYNYSVIIPGEEQKNYAAVSVLRAGKFFTRSVEAENSLQLYGALSENFINLYLCSSTTTDGITRQISYERLTWDSVGLEWGQSYTGQVPNADYDKTQDYPTVDRQGRIYAYVSYTVDSPVNDSDADCDVFNMSSENWLNGAFSSYSHVSNNHTGHFYLWDIDSGGFVEVPSSLSYGISIADGGYHVIMSSRHYYSDQNSEVSGGLQWVWSPDPGGSSQHAYYTRSFAIRDACYFGVASINGHPVCSTQDGAILSYSASLDSYSDNSDSISWKGILSINVYGYTETIGIISPSNIAGWCFVHDFYASHALSGSSYEVTQGQVTLIPQYCTGQYPEINVFDKTSSDVDGYRATWPMTFSCHSVSNAFYVMDQVSDTWYAGALVNYVDGGSFEWLFYKDGGRVTLDSCIGNLFDNNFSTVYFR